MSGCKELVSSVLADEASEWSCRAVDAATAQLIAPRYYADGDAVELLVKTLGDELVVSDGGETLARLEMAGVNIASGRARETWISLLRAHRVDYSDGRVLLRGHVDDAGWLVRSMVDALANLDGLRVLAPSPREMRFAGRLTTFLQAEFPIVKERPELRGQSGSLYRLTAEAGTEKRTVYVQAMAGNSAQARRTAVEHTFTTFADVNGTVPQDRKLVVFSGEATEWPPERLRLLTTVAFVGSWKARDRVTQFIWGHVPEGRIILKSGEQLSTSF